MANSKISGLIAATTPLAGTEELALLQTGDKRVTVTNFAAGAVKSNATTGVMQITGPTTGQTRIATVPDENFTVARTDAAQTFTGEQIFKDIKYLNLGHGLKYVSWQIGTNNETINLLTFINNDFVSGVVKVTVFQNLYHQNNGNIQTGYALMYGQNTNQIVNMVLTANLGNTAVGSLAWSGATLQFTSNKQSNYEFYTFVVEVHGQNYLTTF